MTRTAARDAVGEDALRRMVEAALPAVKERAQLVREIKAALEAGDDGAAIALMRRYCGLPVTDEMGEAVSACGDRAQRPAEFSGVYILHAEGTNLYKIGFSTDIAKRLKALRTMSPLALKTIGVLPGGTRVDEALAHARFAESRHHGEWFEESDGLKDFITRILEQGGARV